MPAVLRMIPIIVCSVLACALAKGAVVLDDFEDISKWKAEANSPAQIKAADTAAVGQGAIQVTMPGMVSRELYKGRPAPERAGWDECEGLSFWAKGDGSDLFGCLAIGEGNPQWGDMSVHFFPLKDTAWKKYVVAWDDFISESHRRPLASRGALPPSGIQFLRIGTRWTIHHNNAKVPAHTYCIDQIELEKKVEKDRTTPKLRDFAEVAAQLKEKKKLRVVCMGDSITAGTSLGDANSERYATLIQKNLRAWLASDGIVVESRAVGGARGGDLRAWVDRDFVGEPPDLLTIMYGYNDKSGGYPAEFYTFSLNDYLDRVARKTGGKTAVLLMTTIPGLGHRFAMMDDFADAVRSLGQTRGLPVCDVQKVFKGFGRDGIEKYFADMAHPNAEGHKVLANTVSEFLMKSAGVEVPKVIEK